MLDRIRTIVLSTLEPEDKYVLWLRFSEEFNQYELLIWERGKWRPILSEIANYDSVLKYIDGKTYVDLGDHLEEVHIYQPATTTQDGLMSKKDKQDLIANNAKISNVQGDWKQQNPQEESYIRNKTHGYSTVEVLESAVVYDSERNSYYVPVGYNEISLVQDDYYQIDLPSDYGTTGLNPYSGEFKCQDTGTSYVLNNGQVLITVNDYGTLITGLPRSDWGENHYQTVVFGHEVIQQLDEKYIPDSLSHAFSYALYDDTQTPPQLVFKDANGTTVASIDATPFITDGMVDSVTIENGNLIIKFNTDAGKQDIVIPISDIFDADNYYTKAEVDNLIEHAGEDNIIEHIDNYDGQELIPVNKTVTLPHYTVADILLQNSQQTLQDELTRIQQALLNRPVTSDLAQVAFSGSYNDLQNKPDLSVFLTGVDNVQGSLVSLLVSNNKVQADLTQETKTAIGNIPNLVNLIQTGSANGTIQYTTVGNATPQPVVVKGLKSAAFEESTNFEPAGARQELIGQSSDQLSDNKLTLHALDNQLKWQNIITQ